MRTTVPRRTRLRRARNLLPSTVGVLMLGALVLGATTGCGSADPAPTRPSPEVPATTTVASVLHVRDFWVKAAESGMTAAFGVLVNDGGTDATVVAATSSVSPMELHEMTMKDGRMVMRAKADGITIKAKSTHTLEPSGDHLMLMDLARPVRPGDEVTFTLTFADGRTAQFTALAKPFTGAEESYDPHPDGSQPAGTGPSTVPTA